MTDLRMAIDRVRTSFDRETVVWAVIPAACALAVTALFAVPNYVRALHMQGEAQRLEAVSSENISQRNNMKLMEQSIAALRDEYSRRCRPIAAGTDRDRLLAAITRQTDGALVREQSIRTGALVPVDGIASGGAVMRREVTLDMTASFESIFGVLDAAEGVDQLVTPRVVEITVTGTPAEQAVAGNPCVRATVSFEEWFEARAGEARREAAR